MGKWKWRDLCKLWRRSTEANKFRWPGSYPYHNHYNTNTQTEARKRMVIEVFLHFFFPFKAIPTAYGGSQVGVQPELQLPTYSTATATATQDLSHICDLHQSSRQSRIPNPLSGAWDGTCNLMVPSQIHFCRTMTGTPSPYFQKDCTSLEILSHWKVSSNSEELAHCFAYYITSLLV